jgi:hypothetical protein
MDISINDGSKEPWKIKINFEFISEAYYWNIRCLKTKL